MSTKATPITPSSGAISGRERLLARAAFEAIWVWDFESERISWEGNVTSIFGYEHGEVVDLVGWWREHVHPEDREGVEEVATNATRGDSRGYSVEYRFRRRDGSWAWVASRCAIERDAAGRAVRAVGTMIDISRLKDAEMRLRLFTEQLPARACVTDRELRVVWDAGAGFSAKPSVVGKTVSELFEQSPDRERVVEGCRRALAGESCRLEINDGTVAAQLQLEPFRDPAGAVIGVVGMAFDITDRVRSEQKARAGEGLLRQVLDLLPVGVAVVNRAGDLLLHNAALSRIWGQAIVSGQERWARSKGSWHASGRPIGADEWASERALATGETSMNELIDIEAFDGRRKTIENYAAPVRDDAGGIVGAVILNQDVTARVQAEEGLRRTERLLVEASELGQTGSWEEDLATGQVFDTEGNRRLFFGEDQRQGARLEDYLEAIHPDDRAWVSHRREELLAGTGPGDIEYRVVWPDGSVHWLSGRATVVRDPLGRAVRLYGTRADITERRRAEEALRDSATRLQYLSRRLLAVQEEERRHLSRELHDEFGQLLAAIAVQVHAAKGLAEERVRSRLDEIATLVHRAADEVRTLALELRPTMLETAGLDATLRWLAEQHQLRTGVPTTVVGHSHVVSAGAAIVCFRVAQEALTNILRHARARNVSIEVSQNDHVLDLVVRDDGVGFDVTRLEHAAERGHLGVLGMRERAEILGGSLQVEAQPGHGTQVRVTLPLAQAGGEPGAPAA